MYACSPRWRGDWIPEKDLEKILAQLSGKIKGSPLGPDSIGINYGLHFTGGEPFLNFDLLLKAVKTAHELRIPSTFVETNCFWCIDEETTREKLTQLKDTGLNGILISVNPFTIEQIPFERTQRAIKISEEVFGRNLLVYQEFFYSQFRRLGLKKALNFEEYLQLHPNSLSYVELIPMGRVPYRLGYLFKKYPAKQFFGESCREELTRDWHIHIDNYCNYITGYCAGISLGDAGDLELIYQGIDLNDLHIIGMLVSPGGVEKLFKFGVENFSYRELDEGYISKCHLCTDVRRHIAKQTDEFKELKPKEFYFHL